MVKTSQYVELANDLEINKAITYLRQRDFNQVRLYLHNAGTRHGLAFKLHLSFINYHLISAFHFIRLTVWLITTVCVNGFFIYFLLHLLCSLFLSVHLHGSKNEVWCACVCGYICL